MACQEAVCEELDPADGWLPSPSSERPRLSGAEMSRFFLVIRVVLAFFEAETLGGYVSSPDEPSDSGYCLFFPIVDDRFQE
jgi:hypothetical protein